jgi:hypothetical protein
MQGVIEKQLVLRVASLLWRLRPATAIETGLLHIQADIQRRRGARYRKREAGGDLMERLFGPATTSNDPS